jgi:S1-C subfamily serine protease
MAKYKDRLDEEIKSAYRSIKKGLAKQNKGKCLDEETLISYIEKRLNKAEEEAVEKHLSLCSQCSEYVVVMNRVLQRDAREKLPQVSNEMIAKAKNLVKKPREGIGMKKPTKSRGGIAEWIAKVFPPLKPIPLAVGTVALVLLVVVSIFTLYKQSPGPDDEISSPFFDLTASLTGKSQAFTVRGAPKGVPGKVLIEQQGVLRSGDEFQVSFNAGQDAYIYLFIKDSKGEVGLLPKIRQPIRVIKDNKYVIPAKNDWFWLDENVGKETIFILATENPLDATESVMSTLKSSGIDKLQKTLGSNLLAAKVISILHTDEKLIEDINAIEKKVGAFEPQKTFESESGQEVFNNSKNVIQAFIRTKENPIEGDVINVLDKVERGKVLEATRGVGGSLVYKKAAPAVVVVVSIKGKEDIEGMGSGAILDAEGHVVTNWHVVQDIPEAVVILKPSTGVEIREDLVFAARVVKVDALSDLALLKIKNPPKNLPTLKLGSIKEVEVGQEVHAIGHPKGEVWTYSKGVISQIRPNYEWTYEDGSFHKAKVIQTQTPINPGSSGSPLLNDQAAVIGINACSMGGEGLNYAVSTDAIQEFLRRKGSRVAEKKPFWADMEFKYYKEFDLNKDGIVDLVILDVDGDKKPDLWIFDENQDNQPDYWGGDENGNGILDVYVRDLDKDGVPETYEFDKNEDGKIDLYGIDYDKDFEIDRYYRG